MRVSNFFSILTLGLIFLNILQVTVLIHFLVEKTPINMDKVRSDHIKEMREFARDACVHGSDFYPAPRAHQWGDPWPVDFCNAWLEDMDNNIIEGAMGLGLPDNGR